MTRSIQRSKDKIRTSYSSHTQGGRIVGERQTHERTVEKQHVRDRLDTFTVYLMGVNGKISQTIMVSGSDGPRKVRGSFHSSPKLCFSILARVLFLGSIHHEYYTGRKHVKTNMKAIDSVSPACVCQTRMVTPPRP